MITFLETLIKDVKYDLWLIQTMVSNRIFSSSIEEKTLTTYYELIGMNYVLLKDIEGRISKLEKIKSYCKSEIAGTYYNDHLKEFEGSDCETKYTPDMPYEDIKSCWDTYPQLELEEAVSIFIEFHGDKESIMAKGLFKFFPNVPVFSVKNGIAQPTDLTNIQMSDMMKTGSKLALFEEYNIRINKIYEIAENKGNLAQILELINN